MSNAIHKNLSFSDRPRCNGEVESFNEIMMQVTKIAVVKHILGNENCSSSPCGDVSICSTDASGHKCK